MTPSLCSGCLLHFAYRRPCRRHNFRVKLTIAGKDIVKEEDFEELTSDSLKDYDVSSISGSEDEADKLSCRHDPRGESVPSVRTKLFIRLQSGERVSFWKCLMLNESESVSYEDDKSFSVNDEGCLSDLQELLASWKPYFDASICVFIYAPSTNRQLLFNGDKSYFSHQCCTIQNIPLAVRRPTLKETQRVYRQLTQVAYEVDEKDISLETCESSRINSISNCDPGSSKEDLADKLDLKETFEASSSCKQYSEQCLSSESESEVTGITTSLHEAAQSSIAQKVLELLEQGLDPCIKDENGRTPYMLASEKEVRNTFRRFMASNPDKWDWHAAKVPSALTKEMEESQAAKQAEKDAKRKARAKELKKLRKAREKRAAQAQAAENAAVADNQSTPSSVLKGEAQLRGLHISKEEELKRSQAAEREKRAAAAERRMAAALALNAQGSSTSVAPSTLQPKTGLATDINCSCCGASLAGKVPFHRYNYKYCSTSCMHVHREVLEDG
ncbi:ANK REP REGION domain-containing protein [Citrus sinensis]|uniref:ANK REP REGION domain-containing protein n=1 Tax=Citrus sinensis TaxID=2711 RepID=A0ACB8MS57_CITSI|nr:ANK REP REGION domain-containing protein [Citrus sinensis]